MHIFRAGALLLLLITGAIAGQGHVVAWGTWKPITLLSGQQVKIRSLMIDGRVKEYSTGDSHEVTELLSVARRVFRLNNALPNEISKDPQWAWQLGGWMSINSATGRVSELKLPEFDNRSSVASWFQDYTAYCGSSEDGNVHYMVVSQIGRRRPVLKKILSGVSCPAPVWERDPTRVTFETPSGSKLSFAVHDNIAELQSK
jgi:hypothetical protein